MFIGQIRATSDPSQGMEPIEGGQSGTAPVCTASATATATATDAGLAKKTREVEQDGGLVVQVGTAVPDGEARRLTSQSP